MESINNGNRLKRQSHHDFKEMLASHKYSDSELKLKDGEILKAHKVIMQKVQYFDRVFGEYEKDGIDFSNEDPLVVKAVVNWIYTGFYASNSTCCEDGKTVPLTPFFFHVKVYCLAHRIGIPALKEYAMAKFVATMSKDRYMDAKNFENGYNCTDVIWGIRLLYDRYPNDGAREFKSHIIRYIATTHPNWLRKVDGQGYRARFTNVIVDESKKLLAQVPEFLVDLFEFESNQHRVRLLTESNLMQRDSQGS